MSDTMQEVAKVFLEKEHSRLVNNLERATKRLNVTQAELDNLQQKIKINLYLQEAIK